MWRKKILKIMCVGLAMTIVSAGLFITGTMETRAQDIGVWQTTTALPEGRFNSRAVEWNGTIYVTGGRVSGATNTVYRGDINANGTVPSWTHYTMNCYKERHASFVWNNRLYVMAGLDSGGSATSSVYFANINGDGTLGTWTTTTNLPGTRFSLATTVYNGYVYASGGGLSMLSPALSDSLYIGQINVNGTISSWTTSTLHNKLIDHAMVARNGWLYTIGGENDFGVYLDSVYRAQINGDGSVGSWSVVSNLPEGRTSHTVAVSNDQLYVIGGSNYGGAVSTVFNATMYPDGTFGDWYSNTPLPEPRARHTSVAYGLRLYAIGGYYGAVKNTVYYSDTLPPADNHPPNAPTNPSPADGVSNVEIQPMLQVRVLDPDGDNLTVRFYNAADNSLIGTAYNVSSNGTASVEWQEVNAFSIYGWYAIADDGEFTNRSETWTFDTMQPYGRNMMSTFPPRWVLMSFPYDISGSPSEVLDDSVYGDGMTTWSVAKSYDNINKKWITYRHGSSSNTFNHVDNKMGIWLYITSNGGDMTLTTGKTGEPPVGLSITLYAGWNLIGYPSMTNRWAHEVFPGFVDYVSTYKSTSPFVQDYVMPASVLLSHGNAYWVRCTADCVISIGP